MGAGIIVCGLNGVGKSTLGKSLAEKLHYHFLDIEDIYFPKTDPQYLYAAPRTRPEVDGLLLAELTAHERFVFAAVKGDYVDNISAFLQCAVLIDVPKEIRIQRVRTRSFDKFGSRMLQGGDLYEQEERFFALVASRADDTVETWIQSLRCPIIRVDGTRPIEENVHVIIHQMQPMTKRLP